MYRRIIIAGAAVLALAACGDSETALDSPGDDPEVMDEGDEEDEGDEGIGGIEEDPAEEPTDEAAEDPADDPEDAEEPADEAEDPDAADDGDAEATEDAGADDDPADDGDDEDHSDHDDEGDDPGTDDGDDPGIDEDPITIDSHTDGEEVPVGQVTVAGEATVFEGTVLLRLTDPDGHEGEVTFTTASAGGPERGDWEHTFDLDAPGTWTIEAFEDDPSEGEGREPFHTSVTLEAAG